MRGICGFFLVVWTFAVSHCSLLQVLYTPENIHLPSDIASIRSSDVAKLNANLLGVSAEIPTGFSSDLGNLLERPKAAALIVATTPDNFRPKFETITYKLENEAVGLNLPHLQSLLTESFGSDSTQIESSSNRLSSDKLAEINVDGLVQTKFIPLRQELENMHRIIRWLEESGSRSSINAPDVFVIRLSGLAQMLGVVGTNEAIAKEALNEVTETIEKFSSALRKSYTNRILIELITQTNDQHKIVKRQAQPTPASDTSSIESKLNVYRFTDQDYPTYFAIFLGIGLALSLAILFIASGMWNMDAGKDSIIYRMTMTRMKKE